MGMFILGCSMGFLTGVIFIFIVEECIRGKY